MDRKQKIELLKGILNGSKSISEIREPYVWVIIERGQGRFTNPDTGKTFLESDFDKELQEARIRHADKQLSVLRIVKRRKNG